MYYPFYFEITYGYNLDDEYVEKQKAGFLYKESFVEAVRALEFQYGDELLSIDTLKIYGEEGDLFILPVEAGRAAIAAYEDDK